MQGLLFSHQNDDSQVQPPTNAFHHLLAPRKDVGRFYINTFTMTHIAINTYLSCPHPHLKRLPNIAHHASPIPISLEKKDLMADPPKLATLS